MITEAAPRTTAGHPLRQGLTPLVVDVAVPIGLYYLLAKGFGMSEPAALAWSSAVPAVRTVWGVVAQRRVNAPAALMLAVNVAGVLLSLLSGDPRLMLAKEGVVSSVVGLVILGSVCLGRPIMSTALRPLFAKGDAGRLAAWDRLSATSPAFRRAERTFSLVWGTALLTECVVRVVGVDTLPVDTMVWLGTVILLAALAVAFRVSHALALRPMKDLFVAEQAVQ